MSTQQHSEESSPELPYLAKFMVELKARWKLENHHLGALLGVDPDDRETVLNILDGSDPMEGKDYHDRFMMIFALRLSLQAYLKDLEAERQWLWEPHFALNNASPMSMLLEGSKIKLKAVLDYVQIAQGFKPAEYDFDP